MFVFRSELNRVEFELGLSEHIDIMTGKDDIYITLEKQSPDSYDKMGTGLSFEVEYESYTAEQVQPQLGNHVAARMMRAPVPPASQSDMIFSTLQWAILSAEGNVSLRSKENSLYKLGEVLFDSRHLLEFHQCVLDCSYRKKPMAELS